MRPILTSRINAKLAFLVRGKVKVVKKKGVKIKNLGNEN